MAAPIQVFALTGSTLTVGLLGLVQFPALLIGAVFGGALSDAVDRRKLLLWAQVLMLLTSVGLALNASVAQPAVWPIFALTGANAFFSAVDSPARSATLPRLVDQVRLPAAFALQALMFQTAGAIGPAFAGLLIAQVNVAAAFWLDAATFAAAFVAIAFMHPVPPHEGGTRPDFESLRQGFAFVKLKQELQGVFLMDINAMVFGMPRALFPEMGLSTFGGNETTVGLLFAAPGVGAVLAALTSGWVGRIRRAGRATVIAVVVWGLGVTAFGLTTNVTLALIFLAIAGAGDAISAVFRKVILQVTTPDRLRGRLSAVQVAVTAGGPRLGDAEAGLVATGVGPQAAAWSGGLASAIGALAIGRLLPRFRNWVPPDPPSEPRRADG